MKIKVLYVTGWCRSGSTLIGNILNEIAGYFHAGELYYYWHNSRGLGTNQSCGCGALLERCHVWQKVEAKVARHFPKQDLARSVLDAQALLRTRFTRQILRGRTSQRLSFYSDLLGRTYRAISEVTGSRVIVDSGKYPAEAALIGRMEDLEAYYLHLVRDPRATALSWSKPKHYIPAMSACRSTAYWLGFNMMSEALRARYSDRTVFVRYEDFTARPEAVVDRVLENLGEETVSNPVVGQFVQLGTNHTVTGNPDRLAAGPTRILPATESWRTELPKSQLYGVTLMGLPLMARYHYRLAL